MAELQYSKQALKYLRRMPKVHAKKMHEALSQIAEGHIAALNIRKLNYLNVYRLRLGNYRAQYELLDEKKHMVVGKVGIRGDFYK